MKSTSTSSMRPLVLLFTFIRFLSSTAFRMMYPFLPVFRDGLGVSVPVLTQAIGARSLFAGLLGPFFASLSDSRGRRQGMLVGIVLFLAGSVSVVIWPTFNGLILAMMLTILGKVTFDPSIQAFIGDRVPYEQRSRILTLTELSWSGAYILGIPMVGWAISRAGWVAPFPLLGALVLVSAIFLLKMLPREPAVEREPNATRKNFQRILGSRTAMMALIFIGFIALANEIINLTFGLWMEASFGLQLAALGGAAAILGISELGGEGLVALITDHLGKRRAILMGVLANSIAVALLPLTSNSITFALAALFLFYFSFEFTIVSSIPLMTEVMPSARATMMAGFFSTASLGRAAASWFTPDLYAVGFSLAIVAVIAANLISLIFLMQLDVRQ
jgi:predicted MFS family arabinose efflux permease